MKILWLINRYKDPNYGDIGICKSLSEFLISNGYKVRNFDFIGKKFRFQFTRVFFIFVQSLLIFKEKPELLIIGGGQLLLNNRNFPYGMLGWYLVSKISGIPLLVFSVGTERSTESSFFYNLILKLFLNHAKEVYLRDSDSREAIHRLTGTYFKTTPDAVYLSYKTISASTSKNYSHTIFFVSKKPKSYKGIENYFNLLLDTFSRQLNNSSLKISASSAQDFRCAKEFYEYTLRLGYDFQLEVPESFEQFIEQIAEANTVISSRMHPIIYAHLMEKPFIAIPLNQKTKSMASFLMSNRADFLSQEVKEKLMKALDKTLNNQ